MKNVGLLSILPLLLIAFSVRASDDDIEEAVARASEAAEEACSILLTNSQLISRYQAYLRKHRTTPSKEDFAKFLEITPAEVDALLAENELEDMDDLEVVARKKAKASTLFQRVIPRELYTVDRREAIKRAFRERSRILLTTADPGRLNEKLFRAMQVYMKKMDAELIVAPINMVTEGLDPRLFNTKGVHILTHTIDLHDVMIHATAIPAHRRNPFTNLELIGTREMSQIVASGKLMDVQIPTLNNHLAPHRLLTMGKITYPYQDTMVQALLPLVAQEEEMFGALLLEKHGGNPRLQALGAGSGWHIRHLDAMDREGFSDQGMYFSENGVKKDKPLAVILGDVHVGLTDAGAIRALVNQILSLQPEYIFLHDIFNGHSISHHESNQFLSRIEAVNSGRFNLREEVGQVVTFVNALMALVPGVKIVVVPSNHDFWLKRRLQDAQKVMVDYANAEFSVKLWELYLKDASIPPLLHAMRQFTIDYPERLIFGKHSSFSMGGFFDARLNDVPTELGNHGHAGANGAKGSIHALNRALSRSVSGDSHNADRRGHTVKAGTMTNYRLNYNGEGFSSWGQAIVLAYRNGGLQTYRHQQGAFYTPRGQALEFPLGFFEPGFPKILPTKSDGSDLEDR